MSTFSDAIISEAKNFFSIFFFFFLHFRNLDSILNILKKKITVEFLNLRTAKNVVR